MTKPASVNISLHKQPRPNLWSWQNPLFLARLCPRGVFKTLSLKICSIYKSRMVYTRKWKTRRKYRTEGTLNWFKATGMELQQQIKIYGSGIILLSIQIYLLLLLCRNTDHQCHWERKKKKKRGGGGGREGVHTKWLECLRSREGGG